MEKAMAVADQQTAGARAWTDPARRVRLVRPLGEPLVHRPPRPGHLRRPLGAVDPRPRWSRRRAGRDELRLAFRRWGCSSRSSSRSDSPSRSTARSSTAATRPSARPPRCASCQRSGAGRPAGRRDRKEQHMKRIRSSRRLRSSLAAASSDRQHRRRASASRRQIGRQPRTSSRPRSPPDDSRRWHRC